MINTMTSVSERIDKSDIAIALVLSLLGVLLMYANVQDEAVSANVLAIPLFLIVTASLLWRRRAPMLALCIALVGQVGHQLLFGTDIVRCGVVLPVTLLLVFSAGARLRGRESWIALAIALGLILSESVAFLGASGLFFAVLTVAVWWTGRIVRSRSQMAVELEARTRELREARDERARLEVATDRARLSGELDELSQRRLGELARLADEGARPSDPVTATAALADIERESRRTLQEMRAVVGVLRDVENTVPTAPQPTLTHLEGLLVRAKGLDARLVVEGSPRVLPAGVELSAYRIVEHLLAALDDAPQVEVCVRFADDALELAVSGLVRRRKKDALERARERVQLHGGSLETTSRGGRAEAVASLPIFIGA
jgi:hypothetical protein